MSKVLVDENNLTSIANAIRAKSGLSDTFKPGEMAVAITNIPSGGGSVESQAVNFYNYDGTIVNSYTKEEFLRLESLPTPPVNPGLTSEGWNWTLEGIKQCLNEGTAELNVGNVVVPSDLSTRIIVNISKGLLNPVMTIYINGTINIDWGDDTELEEATGSDFSTLENISHTYSQPGEYTIRVHCVDDSQFGIRGTSSGYGTLIWGNRNGVSNINTSYECTLIELNMGKGAMLAGSYTFSGFHNLAKLSISNESGATVNRPFHSCRTIKHITIPNNGAFDDKTDLFREMTSLSSYSLPQSFTTIQNYTFSNCTSLYRIKLPSTITSIGTYAFSSNSSLKSADLSATKITSLNANLFASCSYIKEIKLPSTITSLGNSVFTGCNYLQTINLPENLTSIGSSAFNSCYSLKDIDLSTMSIQSIESSAFYQNYTKTEFKFPSTLTTIKASAFSNCYGVSVYDFTDLTAVPTLANTNAFQNIFSEAIIIVPDNLYDEWIAASNWSSLTTYIKKASEV